MSKNIISYSLWGEKEMYWFGALRNIELASKYFPGWICRFYIDKNSKQELIETITGDNVEIVLVDPIGVNDNSYFHHGMFWRFSASEDPEVNIFLSRDCDSRLSEREVSAINEWLESDKDFHIMRDHPHHSAPILGGMWGCRNGIMIKIGLSNLIKDWCVNKRETYSYGIDQDFLREVIYHLVKDNTMEHSEFNLRFGGEIISFPTIRNNYEFVGDVFDENDFRHPQYWTLIKNVIG
jgi:hypothetical protein